MNLESVRLRVVANTEWWTCGIEWNVVFFRFELCAVPCFFSTHAFVVRLVEGTLCNDAEQDVLRQVVNAICNRRFLIALVVYGSDENDAFVENAVNKILGLEQSLACEPVDRFNENVIAGAYAEAVDLRLFAFKGVADF
ncbi:hypothetical protein [Pseudomonas veronii]|uniref:hypothetical protein n=1 Tax=Pseudomonas veronii TaxID=76761 RepID=UPI001CA451FE|nr:hypothetical protein [Pseudomonas veronii]